ncbi:MAG: hypothetical protein IJ763_02200 [Lachnospiraceae bacterium]|nr:hypothetical protein [Lachnospiraceae bacterium]
MKKLFLYTFLFASVFVLAYFITATIYKYRLDEPNEEVLLTENIIDDYDLADNALLGASDIAEETESVNSIIDNKTDYIIAKDIYIVGIEDGYVIVYLNDKNNVYEYTDIDAAVLKIIDSIQYEKILNNITFDNKEELFDFLESIAS